MKINREDVVQAALLVSRWCKEHKQCFGDCDCPFQGDDDSCFLRCPSAWVLEEKLRTRGLSHDGRGGDGHAHVDARAEADEMRALAAAHGIGG